MKKFKRIYCVLLVVFTMLLLVACKNNDKKEVSDTEKYAGTYTVDGLEDKTDGGGAIKLYPTGDGVNGYYSCTWQVADGKIYMKGDFQGFQWTGVYKIEGDSITYEDGAYSLQGTFKKVKE